jgi:5-methylcytosine-specific restriction endonuclease McrA
MLHVDRSDVSLPRKILQTLDDEMEPAKDFYKNYEQKDSFQQRFAFETKPWVIAKPYVKTLFWSTCAYCECTESLSPLEVEHFRPRSEATNLDGTSEPNCYWWLACDWDNLYLVCQACNFQKKNFFPIEGPRRNGPMIVPWRPPVSCPAMNCTTTSQ